MGQFICPKKWRTRCLTALARSAKLEFTTSHKDTGRKRGCVPNGTGTFVEDFDLVLGCKPSAELFVILESTKGLIFKEYAEMPEVPQDLPTENEFVPNSTKRASITQNAWIWICIETCRRVATCKPGKPGLTSFSETLALFFTQFLSFRKMKVQAKQNGPSKSYYTKGQELYAVYHACRKAVWSCCFSY